MKDLIDNAIDIATKNAGNVTSAVNIPTPKVNLPAGIKVGNLTELGTQVPKVSVEDLKAKLPIQKDPRLLKQEKEAELLEKKAELEDKLLKTEAKTLAIAKTVISRLVLPVINFPPKLPLVNPKVLQTIIFEEKAKILTDLKQKLSRENLKKASAVYTYPLSTENVTDVLTPPNIPPLPTRPSIPPLPRIRL